MYLRLCSEAQVPLMPKLISNLLTRLPILAALCACAAPCSQTGAAISGTVFDPQGRPVPGAKIVLFTTGSMAEWKTAADASGNYGFEALQSGEYLLQADA